MAASLASRPMEEQWWKAGVIYQIYPRSFADSSFSEWADGGRGLREWRKTKYPTESFADTNVQSGYALPTHHQQGHHPRT